MTTLRKAAALAAVPGLAFASLAGAAPAAHALDINVDTKIKPVVDVSGYDTTSTTLFGETNTYTENPFDTGDKDAFLTCVVDKPVYNIGYTGWLDMKPVVQAWNSLRNEGITYALEKSEGQLVNVNYQLQRLGWGQITWGTTSKADAEKLITDLNTRYAGTAGWTDVPLWLATREDAYNYWTEVFMALKVGSDFSISFRIDPTYVDIDVDLWKATLDEAYKTANTHTTFDNHMRPYDVTYADDGTVTMLFRVKHDSPEVAYNDATDYTGTNRDVYARDLDAAYNGSDHTFDNFAEEDELTFLQITTPPGVLTVSEENYRKLEGLDPLEQQEFLGDTPRVTGKFYTPFSDESRAHAAMPVHWQGTWDINFAQDTNNYVAYLSRTSVAVDYAYTKATNTATKKTITEFPEEVLDTLPADITGQTLEEAKAAARVPDSPAVGDIVETDAGTWKFKGWAEPTAVQWTTYKAVDATAERRTGTNIADCKNIGIEGEWEFTPKPTPEPVKPVVKPIKPAKLAKTGTDAAVLFSVAGVALVAGAGLTILKRHRKN